MTALGSLDAMRDLYLGIEEKQLHPEKLEDMSEAERLDMFQQACNSKGIKLDPALFKKEATNRTG